MASGMCMHGSHPALVDHGCVQSTGWCKTLDQYILGVMLHHGKTDVLFPGCNIFADLLSLPRDEKLPRQSCSVYSGFSYKLNLHTFHILLIVESSIKAIFNVCSYRIADKPLSQMLNVKRYVDNYGLLFG